ncbi:nicotinamide mononucleotide transporter [Candidatus Saccharibacteria bacterium]|nr:nicotinamide mononucleotide transporter [Candidatus Saccharibacteria bacterium]
MSSKKVRHQKSKLQFNLLDLFCFAVGIVTSIIVVFFYHENSPFYTFMSIVALNGGIICTVLNIKGRRSNFIYGFVESFACGYTSLANHFYGNALINFVFYAPSTLAGFYTWGKHRNKDKKVIARKFTPIQAITATAIFVTTTIMLNLVLDAMGGSSTLLDSAATILVIFATLLAVFRYREQWLFWLASDILQLIMWTTTNDPAVLVLRIFFPLSAIYGYLNWRKLIKTDTKKRKS